ncbi:SAM-dependent methyltransferase [Stieleria varia]|uniref:Methyltransferase domain protein n=1 Tax=Stieleria varia TaxID=2528005 RepID=A0A5C6A2N1_9BACT|nr:class I SAM-dependent methyltransferase [Stieleria varia]TWT92713.1 Methyltransferase domain protein [Stieleria varia]
MEILNESIYDHPKYYDLVFGADCAAETKFILGCAERHLSRPARRMFEPACGTGRLLHSLAKRGYTVGGLDLNPAAVDFCNARLARHGFDDRAFVADMSDFKVRGKWDVAFNTINSFRHLDSEAAAMGHMESMARAIRVGGLYLLGVHLTPTKAPPSESESWSARRGHLAVSTHMWTNSRNRKTRVERFGIRFDVHSPSRSFRIEDELVLRSYTVDQMAELIDRSKLWRIAETYDFSYDLKHPIKVDATSEDVVYALIRKPG